MVRISLNVADKVLIQVARIYSYATRILERREVKVGFPVEMRLVDPPATVVGRTQEIIHAETQCCMA